MHLRDHVKKTLDIRAEVLGQLWARGIIPQPPLTSTARHPAEIEAVLAQYVLAVQISRLEDTVHGLQKE